jgi:hypothetical protein
MGSQERVFIDQLSKALAACAEARAAVPLDWDEALQERCRQNIATAMGILQPPGIGISVTWDARTYSWMTWVFDVQSGTLVDHEQRIRDLVVRISSYAMTGRGAVTNLMRLLDAYDARRYTSKLPDEVQKQLASAESFFQAVIDVVGDEGCYPWL